MPKLCWGTHLPEALASNCDMNNNIHLHQSILKHCKAEALRSGVPKQEFGNEGIGSFDSNDEVISDRCYGINRTILSRESLDVFQIPWA